MRLFETTGLWTMTLLLVSNAYGYLPQVFNNADGSPSFTIRRFDNTGIQILLNSQAKAGFTSSLTGKTVLTAKTDPAIALQNALASWNAAGANIRFLPLQPTDKGADSSDRQNVVTIASTAGDLSVLGGAQGALGVTLNVFAPSDGNLQGGFPIKQGQIFDSDILINPGYTFSADNSANTADLQQVMLHELGHVLGSNHSGLLGTTMFPFGSFAGRYLGSDELAFATFLYPVKAGTLGTLTGKVTLNDGTAPVKFGLVTLIDLAAGRMIGSLTDADGSYSVQVPPGGYIAYAEPFNSLINPTNIYLLSNPGGTLNTALVTGGYLPTLLTSSGTTPATLAVSAGATTTAPLLKVTSGASTLSTPFINTGNTGAAGDITNVVSLNGPLVVVSGGSLDIGLTGGGVDATATLQVLGAQGIAIQPGSVRVDPRVNFGGQPLLRATLTIPAQNRITLASLWIVKGASVSSYTGGLVIVPPTPAISNVQDSQSARATIVPGEWVAIYGSNLAPAPVRIWGEGDFINGNLLPNNLDGVTATFDGIPGAIYFTTGGQMNVQAPANISGQIPVVVTNNGAVSKSFTATVAPSAPSFFVYRAGQKLYTAAVHAVAPAGCSAPCIVGDPAATPGTAKARAGETIIFFANGLNSSPAGVIIASPVTYTSPVTVTVGGQNGSVEYAGLLFAGEFQLNVTLPANVTAGDQPISIATQGQTSPAGVLIPIGQ